MGGVIWITGVSGTGKTALAREVVARLRARGAPVLHLDGDALREALGATAPGDFTDAARTRLSWQYARLARLAAAQDLLVVASVIALRHAVHAWLRAHEPDYLEVWLRRRDPPRKHADAEVGRELLAEYPLAPHLVLDNDGPLASLATLAETLIAAWDAHGRR